MYKCKKCDKVFHLSDIFASYLYSNAEMSQGIAHCPACKSREIACYEGKFCHCCGATVDEAEDFCSAECEALERQLREREERRRKIIRDFEISAAIREVDDYNKEHGTRYSYGMYFAMKGQGKL